MCYILNIYIEQIKAPNTNEYKTIITTSAHKRNDSTIFFD